MTEIDRIDREARSYSDIDGMRVIPEQPGPWPVNEPKAGIRVGVSPLRRTLETYRNRERLLVGLTLAGATFAGLYSPEFMNTLFDLRDGWLRSP